MTTLYNEIIIQAPIERIWQALTDIEKLEKYDPTVKTSTAVSTSKSGLNAKRRVVMLDGKNWLEEKITVFKPMELLTFQLTDCSFPVKNLQHSYSFERDGDEIKVKQVMEYQIKFGFFGRVLDKLMIRRQSDGGIKKFMAGLKSYTENKN